jgi:phage terminase large subunit
VCSWYAIDGDGRMYRYREIYLTQRLVQDHAALITKLSAGEHYEATIADHDAEDRATLHAAGIKTIAAHKAVSTGIQAMQARLRPAGDGRPRLYFLRDSLVERDPVLTEAARPCSAEEEIEGYIWLPAANGRPAKEEPLKEDDHGMDCARYAVSYLDRPRNRRQAIGSTGYQQYG